jgi:hypothetical protein
MTSVQNVVKPLEDTYLILQSKTAVKVGAFHTWRLNRPIEINENAYLSLIERFYEKNSTHSADKLPYLIRLLPNSSSIVHPSKLPAGTTAVLEGTIIDIGYDHEPASRTIEVKLPSQQTINEITLQITKTFYGNDDPTATEFIIIVKIVEREPKVLRYGALNNITQRSRL